LLLKNISIKTDFSQLNINKSELFRKYYEDWHGDIYEKMSLLNAYFMTEDRDVKEMINSITKYNRKISLLAFKGFSSSGLSIIKLISQYCDGEILNENKINFKNSVDYFNRNQINLYDNYNQGWPTNLIIFNTTFNSPKTTLKKIFDFSELEKLNSFKIEKSTIE
jgi:hypothetical protein